MSDHVPEARSPAQPRGESIVDDTGDGKPPEGLGIAGGRSQIEMEAGRHSHIDHHLHGLPEMQDHRIRGVRRRSQLRGIGGQALGHAREGSDWDLGYLAGPELDPSALLLDVVTALGTDRVDLVDLARAGAQVRFRAAADGRIVYAADQGTFERFWTAAVTFWCDAEPVIRTGYADVLARLSP